MAIERNALRDFKLSRLKWWERLFLCFVKMRASIDFGGGCITYFKVMRNKVYLMDETYFDKGEIK